MNIVHVCLAQLFIDGFGYQENLLTRSHVQMGHKVTVLTSSHMFNNLYEATERKEKNYVNTDGVHVIVLNRSHRFGYYSKFRDYEGIKERLNELKPDVVFVHGGQSVALMDVISYCKKHPTVRFYIDQHGDYYNMKLNRWQDRFVQHWIYGFWMRRAIPYVNKFWGVTPWRCQYLNDVYKIPKKKIGLLVMGGDDSRINFQNRPKIRSDIRSKLSLKDDDFVIITGGKIDRTKNIHVLIQAIMEMNRDNLKLIVFGQPDKEMAPLIEKMSQDKHICNIGWIESTDVYNYYMASDLAVFPGTHSVLWEQACACGLPGVFKDWSGMRHVDVGGNAQFVCGDNKEELIKVLSDILDSPLAYKKMKEVAQNQAAPYFSYDRIARQAIEIG